MLVCEEFYANVDSFIIIIILTARKIFQDNQKEPYSRFSKHSMFLTNGHVC
jgi:hypothetical protein